MVEDYSVVRTQHIMNCVGTDSKDRDVVKTWTSFEHRCIISLIKDKLCGYADYHHFIQITTGRQSSEKEMPVRISINDFSTLARIMGDYAMNESDVSTLMSFLWSFKTGSQRMRIQLFKVPHESCCDKLIHSGACATEVELFKFEEPTLIVWHCELDGDDWVSPRVQLTIEEYRWMREEAENIAKFSRNYWTFMRPEYLSDMKFNRKRHQRQNTKNIELSPLINYA